jgi:hypothetical protein
MYRKHHNGQLSIEDFHVPFGGTLDSDNRWVIFSSLMPWEELEETYASHSILRLAPLPSRYGWRLVRCSSTKGWA